MKHFISLYFDQDVSVVLAAMLRARKFEVLTTQEANNIGATDEEQSQRHSGIWDLLNWDLHWHTQSL